MRRTFQPTREQAANGWAAAGRGTMSTVSVTRRVRDGLPLRPIGAKQDVRPWYALHARIHR